MKKSFYTIGLLAALISIIIFSPVLTYLIAAFFKTHDIIPAVGSVDSWINFSGAIIGGSITMIALFFTIKYEQDAVKEQNYLAMKPYIFCGFLNYDPESNELLIENCINDYGFIEWRMLNETGNIANDVKIEEEHTYIWDDESLRYIEKDDPYEQFGISIYTVSIEDAFFIPPHGEQRWKTNFRVEKGSDGNYKWCGSAFMLKHNVIFSYSNIANSRRYKAKFEYEININIDVNNELHFFLWNSGSSVLE